MLCVMLMTLFFKHFTTHSKDRIIHYQNKSEKIRSQKHLDE